MSLPNKVLPGFSTALWCQTGATPTALSVANLSVWADHVEDIVGTTAGGTGSAGEQLNVEAVPAYGQDDAVANFSIAGSRQSDKIPTQAAPTSLTITAAWNPSDAGLLLMRDDAESGVIDRTFVITAVEGSNTVAYAFNGRVGGMQWDMSPSAEGKFTFTIHPVGGNSYGWSNS